MINELFERELQNTSINGVSLADYIKENYVPKKYGEWVKKEYWKPLPYDTEPLDYDNYDEKTHSEKVYHYCCSKCNRDEGEIKPTDPYCSNCGAKMIESQEMSKEWINFASDLLPIIDEVESEKKPFLDKTRYISIDDVMSVFDDFMCGEVDEDGTDTFLEMLKDKAESEEI